MRVKAAVLFLLFFWPLAPGVMSGQTATPGGATSLDLDSYISQLEQWSASAARLREHPEEAAALRRQLPESLTVTLPGQRFVVSTRPLASALDAGVRNAASGTQSAEEALARIAVMLEDARALALKPARDDQGARTKLAGILKQREFRFMSERDESDSFWDRVAEKFWEWIGKLLRHAGGHPALTGVLLWGIVAVLGLIFLMWLVYSLTHVSFTNSAAPAGAREVQITWRDAVHQAAEAAGRGDHREAIRILYGAAVRRIGDAGAWQVNPTRTHREYLRLLPADSAYRPGLLAITTRFEQVWYGRAQASGSDYEAALAELESMP